MSKSTSVLHTDKLELKEIVKEVWGTKFDLSEPIPERPPYILELVQNEHRYGIALPGSIIEVSGLSKTRKSTLISMFVGASLVNGGRLMNVESSIDSNIVWFDTEQNEIEFKMFQRNIHRLSRLSENSPRYHAFNIRRYDELVRLDLVEVILRQIFDKFGPIGLIVIDGIADLAYNANEQEPTKKLITQMAAWADNYRSAIFTAIHTNKDGKHSTGALGGFLDKKCSYHIRTQQEQDFSTSSTIVSCAMARGGEFFPPFSFSHGISGLPELDSGVNVFDTDDSDDVMEPKAKVKHILKDKLDELPF